MIALLTDIYVIYHAKNLKITEDENNNKKASKEINQISEKQINMNHLTLKDNIKKKISKTSSYNDQNDYKTLSLDEFTTNDLSKSSSHIAGPITDL